VALTGAHRVDLVVDQLTDRTCQEPEKQDKGLMAVEPAMWRTPMAVPVVVVALEGSDFRVKRRPVELVDLVGCLHFLEPALFMRPVVVALVELVA
jgi:hypothetical protein